MRELPPRLHRQRPFAHLCIRPRGQVDAPDGRMRHQRLRRLQQSQPVGVLLESGEEALHPLALAVAELPGARPGAELLAVVAHHADQLAGLRGVLVKVVDDVLDGSEGDAVAQALLRAEDDDAVALVVGGVAAPVALGGDGGGPEMGIVHDRVLVAGGGQRGGHVRLPDPFCQPRSLGTSAEERLQLVGHARQLADTIGLRQRGQHRLVVAAAQDLHLAALDEGAEAFQGVRPIGLEPVEEGPRVVEAKAHSRVPLQGGQHGLVGGPEVVLEDEAEVAHRLVVVEDQRERDASVGHGGPMLSDGGGLPSPVRPTRSSRARDGRDHDAGVSSARQSMSGGGVPAVEQPGPRRPGGRLCASGRSYGPTSRRAIEAVAIEEERSDHAHQGKAAHPGRGARRWSPDVTPAAGPGRRLVRAVDQGRRGRRLPAVGPEAR